mgnify:CR=1 FL=1
MAAVSPVSASSSSSHLHHNHTGDDGHGIPGFLYKQGEAFKSWKKRFFVLTRECLAYFQSMERGLEFLASGDMYPGAKSGHKGYISLVGSCIRSRACCTDVDRVIASMPRAARNGYFEILTPHRRFRLGACNSKSCDDWINALWDAQAEREYMFRSLPSTEYRDAWVQGKVAMQYGSSRKIVVRVAILTSGFLCLFRKNKDNKSSLSFMLSSSDVESSPEDLSFKVSTSNCSVLFWMSDVAEFQHWDWLFGVSRQLFAERVWRMRNPKGTFPPSVHENHAKRAGLPCPPLVPRRPVRSSSLPRSRFPTSPGGGAGAAGPGSGKHGSRTRSFSMKDSTAVATSEDEVEEVLDMDWNREAAEDSGGDGNEGLPEAEVIFLTLSQKRSTRSGSSASLSSFSSLASPDHFESVVVGTDFEETGADLLVLPPEGMSSTGSEVVGEEEFDEEDADEQPHKAVVPSAGLAPISGVDGATTPLVMDEGAWIFVHALQNPADLPPPFPGRGGFPLETSPPSPPVHS